MKFQGNKMTHSTQQEELDDDMCVDINSGDGSDGKSVLRGVEVREEQELQATIGFNIGILRVRICHTITVPLDTIPMTGRGSNLTKNATVSYKTVVSSIPMGFWKNRSNSVYSSP